MATALGRVFRRSHLGTEADRATFRTLHEASLAGPPLREGLTEGSAERSIRHLRSLLGAPAVALTDTERVLAWDGLGAHHGDQVAALARGTESTKIAEHAELACHLVSCPVQQVILSPLVVDELLVGHLVVGTPYPTAGLVRATDEVAAWVSGQLALAELDASRRRLVEAEVRALRAQISPHFIYNSLGAIASFVRTDPERARDLLLEFADFTRYSFRRHGEFTTLADELRSIERYLLLEQARFGDRLQVTLSIAPEVLPVAVPYLCIQPLVENAVRHGLETAGGVVHIRIVALDRAELLGERRVLAVAAERVAGEVGELEQQVAGVLGIGPDEGRDRGERVVDEVRRDLRSQRRHLRLDEPPAARVELGELQLAAHPRGDLLDRAHQARGHRAGEDLQRPDDDPVHVERAHDRGLHRAARLLAREEPTVVDHRHLGVLARERRRQVAVVLELPVPREHGGPVGESHARRAEERAEVAHRLLRRCRGQPAAQGRCRQRRRVQRAERGPVGLAAELGPPASRRVPPQGHGRTVGAPRRRVPVTGSR